MTLTLSDPEVQGLLSGTLNDPHAYLGMHSSQSGLQVRVWSPTANRVTLLESGGRRSRIDLGRVHPAGLFAGVVPRRRSVFPYTLEFASGDHVWTQEDPYRFLPTIGQEDLYYIGEGSHRRLYDVLGAHPRVIDGVAGVSFAVWAPSARGVSVCGDFNGWNRRTHPMRSMGPSGVWEIFLPALTVGERYKFAIRGADGMEYEKADPLAFASEVRPKTASIIADIHAMEWNDEEWMARRRECSPYHEPMSVYEVHLGSWRRHDDGTWLSYAEIADQLAPYCRENNFTHIELMPVSEHPYDGSWGYQVTGFYSPTSRFGSPTDFQCFVDRFHQEGVGVILDWVPAHFAVDVHSLARFDGTYLYEHADPQRRIQPDWGTYSFNYARHEVRNFLVSNALYWLREYHIDGLRVDGVSSMLYLDYSREPGEWSPNRFGGRENLEAIDFLKEANELIYSDGGGALSIAEESTAWPGVSRPTYDGGLGFGFKWNMGWMHDTLEYFANDPIHRRFHQNEITFSMVYAYDENFVLSLSHDEVVHGKRSMLHKMPGDEWQQFANLRLLHAYQHGHPGKKLIFMGGEFGQRTEWNHEGSLEWQALLYQPHAQIRDLVRDLNRLHREEPALHDLDHEHAGFEWLDYNDSDNSVLCWLRRSREGETILCVFNFTPVPRYEYRIPVPEAVDYRELLNTDAEQYGGSGIGNLGRVQGETHPYNGRPCSAALTLPPLGALYLKPE